MKVEVQLLSWNEIRLKYRITAVNILLVLWEGLDYIFFTPY